MDWTWTRRPQGGKLIAKIIDVLEDVGFAVEDLEVEVEALADGMESMAEDLSDVETVIFDEEDEDENGFAAAASALTTTISSRSPAPAAARISSSMRDVLDIGEVTCPNCGDKFSLDLTDEPVDEDEPEA